MRDKPSSISQEGYALLAQSAVLLEPLDSCICQRPRLCIVQMTAVKMLLVHIDIIFKMKETLTMTHCVFNCDSEQWQ